MNSNDTEALALGLQLGLTGEQWVLSWMLGMVIFLSQLESNSTSYT